MDPIDSAIATAADGGIQTTWLFVPDQNAGTMEGTFLGPSPAPTQFAGEVQLANGRTKDLEARLNHGRPTEPQYVVRNVYLCLDPHSRSTNGIGYLVEHDELPDQARLRWQNSFTPKSYHSAIIGSKLNHAFVTAHDVAIGGGRAASDPKFCKFLCAMADWRLPEGAEKRKDGKSVLTWKQFQSQFAELLATIRPEWRRLISENMHYYSTGELPNDLPLISDSLQSCLFCETTDGTFGGKL